RNSSYLSAVTPSSSIIHKLAIARSDSLGFSGVLVVPFGKRAIQLLESALCLAAVAAEQRDAKPGGVDHVLDRKRLPHSMEVEATQADDRHLDPVHRHIVGVRCAA